MTRDQLIQQMAELIAGLAGPVSAEMPLGRAGMAWTELHRGLVGFGWATPEDYEAKIRELLDRPSRASRSAAREAARHPAGGPL